MIVFKLGFVVGARCSRPRCIIYQAWAFLAPALYDRERKVILPALVVGLGPVPRRAALGYVFSVPQALRVFFSFQAEALQPMITYDAWFGFVLQIVLALGISFELPLVIIILAALGVVTPPGCTAFAGTRWCCCFIAGAVLSPGADVLSMLMMTVPLLLLYEIGVAGPWSSPADAGVRSRTSANAPSLLFVLPARLRLHAGANASPTPGRRGRDRIPRAPTGTHSRPGARHGAGPSAWPSYRPSQSFAPEDSLPLAAQLARRLRTVTKYRSDSAAILADGRSSCSWATR